MSTKKSLSPNQYLCWPPNIADDYDHEHGHEE